MKTGWHSVQRTPPSRHVVIDKQLVLTTLTTNPEMAPGLRVSGSAIFAGSSQVSVSADPVFDPVLSFNMCIYRGVVF